MGVIVAGEVIHTTELAVLVRVERDPQLPGFAPLPPREIWIPRSVCEDGDDLEEGDTSVVVRSWWADREGLS